MLIRAADLALYRTKDGGGGGFHIYEPQLHLQAEERRVLEMALRKALQNDEMHLQYQPVVDSETGGLNGFAELLRRSEEQTSELQSLLRNSYADFCLKKKNSHINNTNKLT